MLIFIEILYQTLHMLTYDKKLIRNIEGTQKEGCKICVSNLSHYTNTHFLVKTIHFTGAHVK